MGLNTDVSDGDRGARRARGIRTWLRDVAVNAIGGSRLIPRPLRWRYLRLCGLDVSHSTIAAECFFGSALVTIGTRTLINRATFLDGAARVTIGDDCAIGMQCMIITGSHEFGPSARRAGPTLNLPVEIGDGAWLGARTVVLPGVTIGAGAIVAAGSLVLSDCEPNSLYAGTPARKIRELS